MSGAEMMARIAAGERPRLATHAEIEAECWVLIPGFTEEVKVVIAPEESMVALGKTEFHLSTALLRCWVGALGAALALEPDSAGWLGKVTLFPFVGVQREQVFLEDVFKRVRIVVKNAELLFAECVERERAAELASKGVASAGLEGGGGNGAEGDVAADVAAGCRGHQQEEGVVGGHVADAAQKGAQ